METYRIVYKNELYHHGVLGQKWGVRRYQNPDGTLTKEGKRRLSINKAEKYADEKLNPKNDETTRYSFHNSWSNYYKKHAGDDEYYPEDDISKKHRDNIHKILNSNEVKEKEKAYYDSVDRFYQAYTKHEKSLKSINVFKSEKLRKEMNALREEGLKSFKEYETLTLDKMQDYIDKMPKSEQDAARAFIWEYLGNDW